MSRAEKLETAAYWWNKSVEAWELSQRYADEARQFAGFARDAQQEAAHADDDGASWGTAQEARQ